MNEELFDYIKRQGLKPGRSKKQLSSWPTNKCLRFIDKCRDIVNEEKAKGTSIPPFSFMASGSFSGGLHPCIMHECRLKRIDSLARFSSLYADKVIIQNPFAKYHCHSGTKLEEEGKFHLSGDIEVLFKIEPLTKANLMTIANDAFRLCSDCLKEVMQRNKKIREKIRKGEKLLEKEFLVKTKVECKTEFEIPFVFISGPDEIIEHDGLVIVPSRETPFFDTLAKLASTKKCEIKDMKIKRYFFSSLLRPTFEDLLMEDMYTTKGYNSITDRKTDIFIRERLEMNRENIEASILMKNLAHAVPNIENVNIENLVKLRKKEGESLKVYRDKINELLGKVKKGVEEEELKSLFESEICPELNKIDLLFKENKKSAKHSFMRKAIVGTASISIGLFSGLLFPTVGSALSALGGFTFLNALSEDLSKSLQIPKEIKTSKYYFLWKVKKLSG